MMLRKMFADYARLFATTKGPKLIKAIAILFVPSLHITVVHRIGYAISRFWLPFRWLCMLPYMLLQLVIKLAYNVSIPARATIGPGFIILHPFGTIIHAGTRIGRNVTVGSQVVLGVSELKDNRAPDIGDEVVIYAGAKVLGPVRVNHHAVVGANAVVVRDVPSYGVVGGVPARVLRMHRQQGQQRHRQNRFPRRPRNESNVRVYNDKREGIIHV